VNDPQFGWQVFGGNIETVPDGKKIVPLDSARTRVYIAPIGLWLTLDAGNFRSVRVNPQAGIVRIGLDSRREFTSEARLHVEQPVRTERIGAFHPGSTFKQERGDYVIPLSPDETWVELKSR